MCPVLLGHSRTHGFSARLKATLCFKRESWGWFFFFMFTKKLLFISHHSLICPIISFFPAPLTQLLKSGWWSYRVCPPLLFFNTKAAENQTPLKQIDVPFNIVVTLSQGPCVSVLVTTTGLLSWAQRWLPRFRSLEWFITKKEREILRRERKGKGEKEQKVPRIMAESLRPLIDKCLIRLSPP